MASPSSLREGTCSAVRSVLVDYDGRRLLERRGVRYDTVAIDRPAWIVLQRRGDVPEPPIMAELGARCRREDHATHVHFACGAVGGAEPRATVTVRPRGGADSTGSVPPARAR